MQVDAAAKTIAIRRAENGRNKRVRTRVALLHSAFEVLGDEVGRNMQIDDVLERAGMSRGTFYNYFTSREDLLNTISLELSHHFDIALEHTADPPTRTSFAIRTYLRQAWQDKQWGWAMVNISLNGPFIFGAATYRYASETLQAGIDTGDFTVPTVTHGLDLLTGTGLNAMIRLLKGEAGVKYVEEIAMLVLIGLGVPRKRAEKLMLLPLPVSSRSQPLFATNSQDTELR